MAHEGFWVLNEETGEYEQLHFEELDPETYEQLRVPRPIGGFCYPAETFKDIKLVRAPFYIGGGWLPKQGKMELYAPRKSGKSFLAMQLARCIGAGEDFLGMPTMSGRVLYLQFELSPEVLQSRMKLTGLEYPNVFVGTTFGMKLDQKGGQTQLLTALEAINPQVVILDPFYKIIMGDENEAKDVKIITDFLDDQVIDRGDSGCSVVIIHHSGKDISRGGRGSSLLEGWVDSYIEMKQLGGNGDDIPAKGLRIRLMPRALRHAELPPEPIEAVLKDFEFVLTGREESIREKVEEYCNAHAEFRSRDIRMANLGAFSRVQKVLNELVEEGRIEQPARGIYRVLGY